MYRDEKRPPGRSFRRSELQDGELFLGGFLQELHFKLEIEIHVHRRMLLAVFLKDFPRLVLFGPDLIKVESFSIFHHVGDDAQGGPIRLEHASTDGIEVFLPGSANLQETRTECGHQGLMCPKDRDLSGLCRDDGRFEVVDRKDLFLD